MLFRYLRSLFYDLFKGNKFVDDCVYDWMVCSIIYNVEPCHIVIYHMQYTWDFLRVSYLYHAAYYVLIPLRANVCIPYVLASMFPFPFSSLLLSSSPPFRVCVLFAVNKESSIHPSSTCSWCSSHASWCSCSTWLC